jgi:hypothetical protein
MPSQLRQTYGIHPTLRHLTILVLYFALLSAMLAPALKSESYLVAGFLLPLSVPILAALVMLLDRRGPFKIWLAGVLTLLFLPALVAWIDWIVAVSEFGAFVSRVVPVRGAIALLVVINLLGLFSLYRIVVRIPSQCPECRFRAFLPLGRLKWCAACGFKSEATR